MKPTIQISATYSLIDLQELALAHAATLPHLNNKKLNFRRIFSGSMIIGIDVFAEQDMKAAISPTNTKELFAKMREAIKPA